MRSLVPACATRSRIGFNCCSVQTRSFCYGPHGNISEVLRQPIEGGVVTIARARERIYLPRQIYAYRSQKSMPMRALNDQVSDLELDQDEPGREFVITGQFAKRTIAAGLESA